MLNGCLSTFYVDRLRDMFPSFQVYHFMNDELNKVLFILPENEFSGSNLLDFIFLLTRTKDKFDIIVVRDTLRVTLDLEDLVVPFGPKRL